MSTNVLHFNTKAIEDKIVKLIEQTEANFDEISSSQKMHPRYGIIMEPNECEITIEIMAAISIPNNDTQSCHEGNAFVVMAGFKEEFDLSTQTLRALNNKDDSVRPCLDFRINCLDLVSGDGASVSSLEPLYFDHYYCGISMITMCPFEDPNKEGVSTQLRHEEIFKLSTQSVREALYDVDNSKPSLEFNVDYWSKLNANNELVYDFDSSVSGLVSGDSSDSSIDDPSACYVIASVFIMGPFGPFPEDFLNYDDEDDIEDFFESSEHLLYLGLHSEIMYEALYGRSICDPFGSWHDFGSDKPSSLGLDVNYHYWDNDNINNEQLYSIFSSMRNGFVPNSDTLTSTI